MGNFRKLRISNNHPPPGSGAILRCRRDSLGEGLNCRSATVAPARDGMCSGACVLLARLSKQTFLSRSPVLGGTVVLVPVLQRRPWVIEAGGWKEGGFESASKNGD